jgi:DNA-directed RNA polymerase specialized sigma24 family protein
MAVATRPVHTATEETDAEIIGRMHGDPAGFATVFGRHYLAIHAYASRRLGSDLAEDVAAETFLVAFGRWRSYDTIHSNARPWLFGIASNLIAKHQRSEAAGMRRWRGPTARPLVPTSLTSSSTRSPPDWW